MSSLSPLQKLSRELWNLHDQVLSTGMDNPQEAVLNKEQRESIAAKMQQISNDAIALVTGSKDSNASNTILPPNILDNLNQLRLTIKRNQYGGDEPNFIAKKLAEIGQRLLSSSSSAAAGEGNGELPLAEQLRKAILLQNRNELHQLLTGKEFTKFDPKVTSLMILPRVQMSTPEELARVFHLLEESFLLKKNQFAANAAAEGDAKSAAAAGVAAAVLSASDRPLSNDKESDLDLFRTKIADILAPIFFKHVRTAFLHRDLVKQNLLLSNPVFQNMSFQIFERQMLDLANSHQWTPTQGEMILDFASSKTKELEKDVTHKFLSRLGKCFDVFTPLSRAARSEGDEMVNYIFSCTKLLAHCDREALIIKFNQLEITLLEESRDEATKLLKVFLSPAWFNLKDETYDKALLKTLLGTRPYHVNLDDTWASQEPVEVDLEKLTVLLSHPFFKQKSLEYVKKLFDASTDQFLSATIGELPFLGPEARKKIVEAVIQHPHISYEIVMSLLYSAYRLQKMFNSLPTNNPRPETYDKIKDTALGDKEVRKPIDDLLQPQMRNNVTAKQLIDGFTDYQHSLHSKHNLSESEEQQFLKRAAEVLVNQVRFVIDRAIAEFDGDTLNQLFDSALFRQINPNDLQRLEYERSGYKIGGEGARQFSRERLLLITNPLWMRVSEQKFKEGFKAILELPLIDSQRLEYAAARMPRFSVENKIIDPIDPSVVTLQSMTPHPHIFIDESISTLLKKKKRLPQKTLHIALKALIQNNSINEDTFTFFLFSNPDLNKPHEEITFTLKQDEEPGQSQATISNELLYLAKQWALEALFNRDTLNPSGRLWPLDFMESSMDKNKDALDLLLKNPAMKKVRIYLLLTCICESARKGKHALIPFFIQCVAQNRHFYSFYGTEIVSSDSNESSETAITGTSESEVKVAAAGAATAMSATAGGESFPVFPTDYEMFAETSLDDEQIDSIIHSSNFELIAQDVVADFTRILHVPHSRLSDAEELWLAKLKDAGYLK